VVGLHLLHLVEEPRPVQPSPQQERVRQLRALPQGRRSRRRSAAPASAAPSRGRRGPCGGRRSRGSPPWRPARSPRRRRVVGAEASAARTRTARRRPGRTWFRRGFVARLMGMGLTGTPADASLRPKAFHREPRAGRAGPSPPDRGETPAGSGRPPRVGGGDRRARGGGHGVPHGIGDRPAWSRAAALRAPADSRVRSTRARGDLPRKEAPRRRAGAGLGAPEEEPLPPEEEQREAQGPG